MKMNASELDRRYSCFQSIGRSIKSKKDAVDVYGKLVEQASTVQMHVDGFMDEIARMEKEKDALLMEMLSDFLLVDEERLYMVLKKHYILGTSWADMSELTGYTVRHLKRLKFEALEKIAEEKLKRNRG